jgi:hypothetical protein
MWLWLTWIGRVESWQFSWILQGRLRKDGAIDQLTGNWEFSYGTFARQEWTERGKM